MGGSQSSSIHFSPILQEKARGGGELWARSLSLIMVESQVESQSSLTNCSPISQEKARWKNGVGQESLTDNVASVTATEKGMA